MKHLECKLVDGEPVFSYLLNDGWSEVKIGQLIFQREGLKELLSWSSGSNDGARAPI